MLEIPDIPTPVGVSAEANTDNTSIRMSWQWSPQGMPTCIVDLVRVHYQPEGGSLVMYTVGSTTATSATLSNLQCNTDYTVWVVASSGQTSTRSVHRMVFLPASGTQSFVHAVNFVIITSHIIVFYYCIPAPPTPTEVTVHLINTSSVRVTWQWTSSGPAPDCFNTTTVTYRSEGGEFSLQLSDPAATTANLTGLQINMCYVITVVATAGEYRRESVARRVTLPLQGVPKNACVPIYTFTYESSYCSIA